MKSNRFTVTVPASTANLGSGFDAVSAALTLHLKLTVERSAGKGIEWLTPWDSSAGENILEQALHRAGRELGLRLPGLRLAMENPIPLGRGLGSSGAAIIAAIKAVEQLSGKCLDHREILDLAYPLEGHPDNLSASLLGGWVLSWIDAKQRVQAEQLQSRLQCRFVATIPETTVSTKEARRILPASYPMEAAVFNLQRCGLLVHALSQGRNDLISEATRDRLHQPFRAELVPGMRAVLQRKDLPACLSRSLLSVTISGSGSTVLALAQDQYQAIGRWMVDTFQKHDTPARFLVLDLDPTGARVQCL